MKARFKLSHSLLGTAALLIVEAALLATVPSCSTCIILTAAVLGVVINLYVATEVIEEVKSARHMLMLLCAVLFQFLVFFTFQYLFLLQVEPTSFPTLTLEPVSLLLHSTMVFAFNPLYLPETLAARALVLINTLGALGLVLFILQNIWQFRRQSI
jgi:hypothetical protein